MGIAESVLSVSFCTAVLAGTKAKHSGAVKNRIRAEAKIGLRNLVIDVVNQFLVSAAGLSIDCCWRPAVEGGSNVISFLLST